MRGLFVTGTDTGVGKTVACAALMHRFRQGVAAEGVVGTVRSDLAPSTAGSTRAIDALRYWKPIQTGIEQDDDTREVCRLGMCGSDERLDAGVRLRRPVSPHLAARLSDQPIDLSALIDPVRRQAGTVRWIVEGAGGALVPVNDSQLMVDAMAALGLPVLIVSRTGLGTINHTLLTLEALRARSLTVAGVLMVGVPDHENRAAIERYGRVPVVGELPPLDPLTPQALRAWATARLDPRNELPL